MASTLLRRFGPPLAVIALALFLLLLACALPALIVSRGSGEEAWPGIQALGLGWLALLIGQFGWLANLPAPFAALLLLLRQRVLAAAFAALSLLMAMHTLALFHQEIPANEASVGPPYVLQRLGPGFYLWVGSMLVLFLGAVVLAIVDRDRASSYFTGAASSPTEPSQAAEKHVPVAGPGTRTTTSRALGASADSNTP